MTLLAAQTTGLPCLISDVISSEMDFDGLIFRESLQESPATWAIRRDRNFYQIESVNEESKYQEEHIH